MQLVTGDVDLDTSAFFFQDYLYFLFDLFFPLRTVRIRPQDPQWMLPSLRMLIDDRDRAHSNKQWSKYDRLKHEVVSEIRRLKSLYLTNAVSSSDVRRVWKAINETAKVKSMQSNDHYIVADPDDYNSYFSSNFQSSCDTDLLPLPTDLPSDDLLVCDNLVFDYLRRLKRKSCGADGIPYWVFRDYSDILTPAVTHIFNRSLREGIVPSCMKVANIKPVAKVPRPDCVQDYRPISLLPILSKVLEKVVANKWLYPYVNGKISSNQFAYLPGPGKGTNNALTLMYGKILEFLDSSSGVVRLLTIDLSKAFDKLTKKAILDACVRFEIPVQAFRWISDSQQPIPGCVYC